MDDEHKKKLEAYQKKLSIVQSFLLNVIDVSERIQRALDEHTGDLDELYEERIKLFDEADGFLAAWIKHCSLSASGSWNLYRGFLLAVEDEHVKKQYADLNKSLSIKGEEHFSVDNPFLIQQDDEVEDKARIDELINKHNITRPEVLNIMSNLTLREITELMLLSHKLSDGSIWEHHYDV